MLKISFTNAEVSDHGYGLEVVALHTVVRQDRLR